MEDTYKLTDKEVGLLVALISEKLMGFRPTSQEAIEEYHELGLLRQKLAPVFAQIP